MLQGDRLLVNILDLCLAMRSQTHPAMPTIEHCLLGRIRTLQYSANRKSAHQSPRAVHQQNHVSDPFLPVAIHFLVIVQSGLKFHSGLDRSKLSFLHLHYRFIFRFGSQGHFTSEQKQ